MIKGIGNDIIEIDRIKIAVAKNNSFLTKIYTKQELEYYKSKGSKIQTLAGMFCAKEAVSKALGTGFRGFGFTDIEILRNEFGRPEVRLHLKAKDIFESSNYSAIFVSISHCKTYASAVSILE